QWRIGLTTVEVRQRELVERLVAPGRVIAPPGAGAVVNSPVPGRIAPPPGGQFVQVGEKVEQGRLLGLIEPAIAGADAVQLVVNQAQLQSLDADLAIKQLDLEAQIRNAELAVARTQDVHDRKNSLVEQGVIPGKDLLLAQHELALAEGRLGGLVELRSPYASARQRLSSVLGQMQSSGDVGQEPGDMRVTLRSPIAGTVVEVATTSGELTPAGQKLFRILNLDTLWIEANISEYDLANVQQAPGASYRLAAYPDEIVSIADRGGHLIDVGAEVDPDTRTLPIRYEVLNHDGLLRVGMFADLLVETRRREKALAVPKEAIMDEAGQAVVYVQLGGESFQRRPVRLGIRDADLVEIREGLTAGERVATKGAYSVRLATLSKQTIGHGHTH
ncbi:MAG: efflux RND transporter periplasmic adaptor subunit, partial [Planctomycetes bacterium]|nr:efflux RND transporter periplasmic adaptor subunit [Planctomycetota bacterium]